MNIMGLKSVYWKFQGKISEANNFLKIGASEKYQFYSTQYFINGMVPTPNCSRITIVSKNLEYLY